MNAIERGVAALCQVVLWISTSVIFLILVANTVLRYATGASLQWANEVPEVLFPWLVMSGVVLAASRGSHLSIMFITQRLHGAWLTAAVSLRAVVVIYVYSRLTAAGIDILPIVADEHTAILGASSAWTYGCVIGGIVLLVVEEVFGWLRQVLGVGSETSALAHAEAL